MTTLTSPVEEFPGTVEMPERLTLPQALAYERAIKLAQATEDPTQTEYDVLAVEVVCECVEEWNLEGFGQLSPDTFPATPRAASANLIGWLFNSITEIYIGKEVGEVPKE